MNRECFRRSENCTALRNKLGTELLLLVSSDMLAPSLDAINYAAHHSGSSTSPSSKRPNAFISTSMLWVRNRLNDVSSALPQELIPDSPHSSLLLASSTRPHDFLQTSVAVGLETAHRLFVDMRRMTSIQMGRGVWHARLAQRHDARNSCAHYLNDSR